MATGKVKKVTDSMSIRRGSSFHEITIHMLLTDAGDEAHCCDDVGAIFKIQQTAHSMGWKFRLRPIDYVDSLYNT
jgi:hypothetical protein